MSHQMMRIIRLIAVLLVVAIVLNDGIRITTAYAQVINGARDGLDAAAAAVFTNHNGTNPARDAVAARGAALVGYEAKRESNAAAKTAHIRLVAQTTAPGMIVVGPIMNASAGVPSSQWWSTAPVIDWNAERTINLTTGMTIN